MKSPWQHIGNVRLRNLYKVERSNDQFRVSSSNARGAERSQLVAKSVVDHLRRSFRGQTVIVEEAERELARIKSKLPYQYGFQLGFFAQYGLVILVALELASCRKAGHRFEYDVS
jgi:hypothetical protein